jgi:hypothetical protein
MISFLREAGRPEPLGCVLPTLVHAVVHFALTCRKSHDWPNSRCPTNVRKNQHGWLRPHEVCPISRGRDCQSNLDAWPIAVQAGSSMIPEKSRHTVRYTRNIERKHAYSMSEHNERENNLARDGLYKIRVPIWTQSLD